MILRYNEILYLSKYIPSASDKSQVLRLRKDTEFIWAPNEKVCFETLKGIISKVPVLAHFNQKKSIMFSDDANQRELGLVLLQEVRPSAS